MSNKHNRQIKRESVKIADTILEIKHEETDWVIGPNEAEILEWYCEEMGFERNEFTYREVPKEEWPGINIIDPDIIYDEDLHEDDDEYNVIGTMAELAADHMSGIMVLCSTSY